MRTTSLAFAMPSIVPAPNVQIRSQGYLRHFWPNPDKLRSVGFVKTRQGACVCLGAISSARLLISEAKSRIELLMTAEPPAAICRWERGHREIQDRGEIQD